MSDIADALPDWRSLTEFLAHRFNGKRSDQPGFVTFELALDASTTTVGCFRLASKMAREWIALVVRIGPSSEVSSAASTLIKNFDLPIGVLGFLKNVLVVRQTLPLDGLTQRHVAQTAMALVRVSQTIRSAIDGGADLDEHPFGYVVARAR